MRLLLDTHIFVWAATDDDRLPPAARDLVADPANTRTVSVASAWEMAIKAHSGRWPEAGALVGDLTEAIDDLDATFLTIDHRAAVAAGRFAWAHRDPFDRMIAAQATLGRYDLLTVDPAFADAGAALALAP